MHPDVILVERGLYPPDALGRSSRNQGHQCRQIRRVVLVHTAYQPMKDAPVYHEHFILLTSLSCLSVFVCATSGAIVEHCFCPEIAAKSLSFPKFCR
jgi:hypothetical protein